MNLSRYSDHGQAYAEEVASGGYDEQTTLQRTAAYCSKTLRGYLNGQIYDFSRKAAVIECRSEMAHAMAEDMSGVARIAWRYLRSARPGTMHLTPGEVAGIQSYNAAHSTAYRELDALDYAGLLTLCETLAGERQTKAA